MDHRRWLLPLVAAALACLGARAAHSERLKDVADFQGVTAPPDAAARTALMARLEAVEIAPDTPAARVIVNARTGTIVIGGAVRVSPAAVAHGNLIVRISEDLNVSQPAPFSGGRTVVTPRSTIGVEQEPSRMFLFAPGVALSDLVDAVNRVGASPSDLVAILEALKQAGALKAELIVI